MKIKKALSLIMAFVVLASVVIVSVSVSYAAGRSWPTFTFCTVAPNPVGVNQQVLIYVWLDKCPPTATGPYGDRWTLYIDITDPSGTKTTIGPLTSDPIGFAYTTFTPDKVGVYKVQGRFEGQTLAGKNLPPEGSMGAAFIGDYYQPSQSRVINLVVQEEPLQPYPDAPLPTQYWTRPIDARYHSWSKISGNWMGTPAIPLRLAGNTEGPETSHILWAKPLTIGGLVGGDFGAVSYYTGNAYEGKWWPPVIINGILYYNQYPSSMAYDEISRRATYYMNGVHAVDLRTGEELWYNPNIRIDFGQIFQYDSMNQHGAIPCLWRVEGTTYICYDAWTGRWFCNITNVPTGTRIFGPKGQILIYVLNTARKWIALWDSSAIWQLTGAYDIPGAPPNGTAGQMWRPFNKVVDGRTGFVWNKTLPLGIEGSINYVLPSGLIESKADPQVIIGSVFRTNYVGPGFVGTSAPTANFTIWCLSAKDGSLLWKKDYIAPLPGAAAGLTYSVAAASIEEGIFLIWSPQARQYWAFSLKDGSFLWGPTEAEDEWDFTVATSRIIAYGKVLSCGYGGVLYCYDAKSGKLLWTFEAKDPYYLEAKWTGRYPLEIALVADGKVYVYSGEHSPDNPAERGAYLRCIDIETGKELWKLPFYFSHWARNPAIADGIFVYMNAYDLRIYAIGRGPSATEVTASPKVVAKGESLLIEGKVTDQSAGAKNTPAIADEFMDAWMEHLYMQAPAPTNIHGVDVTLQAVKPDGTTINLGKVTCDSDGRFSYLWAPPEEGTYTIIAIFEGSKSYWPSCAETAVGVASAKPAAVTVEQAESMQTSIDELKQSQQAMQTLLNTLIIIVIICMILVLYDIYVNRKILKK